MAYSAGNPNQLSKASGGQHFVSTAIYNPAVPFVHKLSSVETGNMFYISGIPSKNAGRFRVIFGNGQDKIFRIAARLDNGVIARNTFRNGGWKKEENALNGVFPFQADEFFDMNILVQSSGFKVAINNQPSFDFAHRIPFHRIDTLRINGDVRLCKVQV
ncbi:galectin-4-like isoform X2 [Mercenaria mercenaria]|uniref:galectin-4-like isoform X2 n=1 Tax=Mercenaria mercenaria TaxID=6596 RepID=UPI001E1E0283|nr:galectin-4-like isoform X2 [Mercenaria mercenaria]